MFEPNTVMHLNTGLSMLIQDGSLLVLACQDAHVWWPELGLPAISTQHNMASGILLHKS